MICCSRKGVFVLVHADVLEPVGPTVFLIEPGFTVGELAGDAALAFG